MLSIRYRSLNDNEKFIRIVSIEGDKSSMAGHIVLTNQEFNYLKEACQAWDSDEGYPPELKKNLGPKPAFFKFEEIQEGK